MKDDSKGLLRRIAIVTMSALIMIPSMPWPVFAGDSADAVSVVEAESPTGMVTALPGDDSVSNDELLWGYLDEELTKRAANGGEAGRAMLKAQRATRGSRLGTYEKIVYDSLKAQIETLVAAEGTEESADTVFTVPAADILGHEIETALIQIGGEESEPVPAYVLTAEDLEIMDELNGLKVVDALLADMPYEMFWFDKTTQYSCGLVPEESWVVADGGSNSEYFPSVPEYAVCLNVAKAYSVDGLAGTTKADLNKLRAVQNAVATADSIISSESGNTDYKKLVHYFNRICDLTSYNYDAMEEPSTPYGDPWQMIYVFDGDPDTNVVCEGYSKAFQYLCDHTAFSNDSIECHTVTGDMRTGVLGTEEHMWNILHMEDGSNYIADLTNSDTDSEDEPAIGYAAPDDDPDGSYLFLNGYSGTTIGGGYKFRCSGSTVVTYKYDNDTKALYSSEELTLSDSSYVVNEGSGTEPSDGLSGDGTEDSPYLISSEDDLILMVSMVADGEAAAYYALSEDIEITAESIDPIGTSSTPFTGNFDGQNHKITGYSQKLAADDGNYGGLFGRAQNAVIRDVTMESVNIDDIGSGLYVGGIVGYMNGGTLTGCKVLSGSVSSVTRTGGLAGYINIDISSLENGANVSGSVCAGGIAGSADSSVTLSDMKNTGAVTGGVAGGITSSCGKISSSNNSGAVTGTTRAGGIVEEMMGPVTDCSNTGKVKADYAGGIAGNTTSSYSITRSSNHGEISGSQYVGGIIGAKKYFDSTIAFQCYNTGKVTCTGSGYAGGIVGRGFNDANNPMGGVGNCFNTGKVSGPGRNCGIGYVGSVGRSYNIGIISGGDYNYAIGERNLTNCFYLGNRGTGASGATSLTPEQMEQQESFAGFDFDENWTMDGAEEYPYPELASVAMITDKIDAVEIIREAEAISQRISGLPENITLDDETEVKAIREQYDEYVENYGEDAQAIDNIGILTAAEATIADLKYAELHNLENAVIDPIDNVTFNRSEQKPEPVIRIEDTVLTKGTDYTLEYSANINVGTATVTATGAGDYTGTKSATFTIVAKEVSPTITITGDSFTYSGSAIEPEITVKDGTAVLAAGTDYEVAYSDNVNAGTGSVKAALKGNYSGENTAEFTISAKAITPTIELGESSFTFDGEAKEPAVTVKDGNTVLNAGADYTVDYSDNINAGTGSVKATLKGNYSGENTAEFTIAVKSITPSIELEQTEYTYDGNAKEPAVTVKDGTTVLNTGTDYTVAYSDNVEIGTAKVTVVLKGNYEGTASAEFAIEKSELQRAKEEAIAQLDAIDKTQYSGDELAAVEQAISDAKTAINNAESIEAVDSALSAAKETIAAQKTDAQKNAEDAASQPSVTPPAAPVEILDLPAVKISKPASAKKKLTVKWKKVSKKNLKKISGIQIQVATDPGFTNIVKTATAGKKKTSKKIGGLQPKTKYYVRIRAYGAANHYSVWKNKTGKTK